MFVGHSMVEGYSAGKYIERFADAAVAALRRHRGVVGGIGHKKTVKTATLTDYPFTISGTTLAATGHGMSGSGGGFIGAGGPWGPITVAIPAGHTSVDVVWSRGSPSGGSFSWALDGGSATNVDTSGAASGYQVTSITGLGGTAHSLVLATVSGQSVINGVTFYNGDETTGIRGWESGRPSNTSSAYNTNAIASNTRWLDMIAAIQPALLVVTLMANDYTSGLAGANPVPSATTKTSIKAVVDGIAARCTVRPSVVMTIENQRNNLAMTEPWAAYVTAAYELATAEGYAVLDLGARFGGGAPATAVTAGLINADTIHPTGPGHRVWGEAIADFIHRHA
jgi:lysophospholipase L1-like esterase